MMGSIVKRGRTYSVVFSLGTDHEGKRVRSWHPGYRTRKEAEQARTRLGAAILRGDYVAPSRATLGEHLLERWLPSRANAIRANTLANYRNEIQAYVLPSLGSRQLQDLRGDDLDRLYTRLEKSGRSDGGGLSAKTIRNVHGVLHRALKDAVKWGLVARNVADHVDPPRAPRPKPKHWSGGQLRSFLSEVSDDEHFGLFAVAASTGLRRSELLGLAWDSVDLDRGSVTVIDTLVMVGGKPVLREGEAKTASSRRSIAIDGWTIEVLRRHRVQQLQRRMSAGEAWQDSNLVFCRPDGSHLHPDWMTRRFQTLARRAGLQAIGLHGLRHTWATLALVAGVHVKVVSERMGHSNISTTLDLYSHVIEGMDRDAAEQVAGIVFGN